MEKVSAWHGTAPQYAPHPPPKKTRFLTLKPIFNVMFVASCHFPDLLSENKTTHDCGIKTTLNKNKSSLSIVFWKLSSFSLGIIIISHLHLLQIFLGPKTSFLSPPMEITICPYPTPPLPPPSSAPVASPPAFRAPPWPLAAAPKSAPAWPVREEPWRPREWGGTAAMSIEQDFMKCLVNFYECIYYA